VKKINYTQSLVSVNVQDRIANTVLLHYLLIVSKW